MPQIAPMNWVIIWYTSITIGNITVPNPVITPGNLLVFNSASTQPNNNSNNSNNIIW